MDDIQLRRRRKNGSLYSPIPDDIVWDILSRLPTKAVLKCRIVCKRWREVLSTQVFLDMHKKNGRTVAVILAEERYLKIIKFLEVDATAETPRTRRIEGIRGIQTVREGRRNYVSMLFSYDGLVVLKENDGSKLSKICLLNPMINPRKEVKIVAPRNYEVCGIFFHPNVKEYCILWNYPSKNRQSHRQVSFKLLTLGSQPSWRELPSSASVSNYYEPVKFPNRVVAQDILYWLARKLILTFQYPAQIIAFDIKMEIFSLIPHPNTEIQRINRSSYIMNLLKMDDHLSLVECSSNIEELATIDIWIMKDNLNKFWMRIHKIVTRLPYFRLNLYPFAFVNEAFVLTRQTLGRDRTISACNLKSGTITSLSHNLTDPVRAWVHVPSLVSLMNCKSNIVMPEVHDN